MNGPISELQTLTQTEKLYRCTERIEAFHAECEDWKAVLHDKWFLLIWTGGN